MRRFFAGELVLSLCDCDLTALVGAMCTAASALMSKAPPIHFAAKAHVCCRVDEVLIERAFMNLLSNSLCYTRDGNEINVSVSRVANNAVITIADRGAGIKEEVMPHIKEPYFSCDPYNDGARMPGEGLGLTAANAAAIQHGGTLILTSRFGEGTTAALSIPVAECQGDVLCAPKAAEFIRDSLSPVCNGLSFLRDNLI